MANLDADTSIRRLSVASTSTQLPTNPAEAEAVLEFFSASHGKWIPVEIIDRNAQGDVQVSAKPGSWLLAKDCKRKLRERVYNDDPTVKSTVRVADASLLEKAARAPRRSTASVVGCESNPGSLKQPMSSDGGVSQLDHSPTQNAGYPRQAASSSTTDNTQAPRQRLSQASQRSCYSCPRCGMNELPSFESAVQHCAASETAAQSPTTSSATTQATSSPIADPPGAQAVQAGRQRNGLRYIRAVPKEQEPETGEPSAADCTWNVPLGVPVAAGPLGQVIREDIKEDDSALPVEGVGSAEGGETDSTRSSETQRPQEKASGAPNFQLVGEAIAYNIKGDPIIARTVSDTTGAGVTTVMNDDGSKCTFGANTLASLMSSCNDDALSWIGSLTTLETRGLVHEIGQVLLSTSAVYQFHLNRLQALGELANYSYFGLTADATDAEIDRAYKKLAKQMHPDKNGGTADAKERFQKMKEKYEALKKSRREGGEGKKDERRDGDAEKEDELDEDGNKKPDRPKEAYDEDDDVPKKEESQKIAYDPTDPDSLASTALEMLQRLKAIEGSMSSVMDQLKRNGL